MTDFVLPAPAAASAASTTRKWKVIKVAWPSHKPSEDLASFHMLSLHRTNLGVRLRAIDETALGSECQKRIYATVADMLKAPPKASTSARNLEWDEIYKAESLIALLYGGEQLRREIGARLQELERVNKAEAAALRQDYQELTPVGGAVAAPDDTTLRALLLRVLEALHLREKKANLARPLRLEATNRILFCLLVSFGLLVVPYCFLIWDYSSDATSVHRMWSLFALYTALSAGLLGAFSSRLNSIQRQAANMSLEEVFLQREWSYTLLRAGVGVCGALVVYFFLRSGIAEGALFPKFEEIRIELVTVAGSDAHPAVAMAFAMPSKSLALLTFWCFIAGFSETLVSSILRSTEKQLTDATTPSQATR